MMSSTCCKRGVPRLARLKRVKTIPQTSTLIQNWMGVYVAATYPLASQTNLQWEQLHTWRELCLNTYLESNANVTRGPAWSVPNYLLLLSMAVQ